MAKRIASQANSRLWIETFMKLHLKYDSQLNRLLRSALQDVRRELKALEELDRYSADVRRQQLKFVQEILERPLEKLWQQIARLAANGQREAAQLAAGNGVDWDESLLETFMRKTEIAQLRRSLQLTAARNVEAAVIRETVSKRPLSANVFRARAVASGYLDRTIFSGLARGLSAAQLAKDIEKSIRPDTPGGVAYAAKRLARTEINNAYHATSIIQNAGKPWVTGTKWHTSRSHKHRDECDQYANDDEHGLGRGVFPTSEVPAKPHPNCFCYITPETMSASAFAQAAENGEFDAYLVDSSAFAA